MLFECDYDSSLLDVIVVDNASTDGSPEMVEQEFPQVRLIRRSVNARVSAWNDERGGSSASKASTTRRPCGSLTRSTRSDDHPPQGVGPRRPPKHTPTALLTTLRAPAEMGPFDRTL